MSIGHAKRLEHAVGPVGVPRFVNDVLRDQPFFGQLAGLPPEQRRLVRRIFEKGKELCDPQTGINSVWAKAKSSKIISLNQILDVYVAHCLAKGETDKITEGIKIIAKAYKFAERSYEVTATIDQSKRFRKDGRTPRFAHPLRTAKVVAHLGGEAEDISALILHDVVEDCKLAGVTLALVKKEFGYKMIPEFHQMEWKNANPGVQLITEEKTAEYITEVRKHIRIESGKSFAS